MHQLSNQSFRSSKSLKEDYIVQFEDQNLAGSQASGLYDFNENDQILVNQMIQNEASNETSNATSNSQLIKQIGDYSLEDTITFELNDVRSFFDQKMDRFSSAIYLRDFKSQLYSFKIVIVPNYLKTNNLKPKSFNLFVYCQNESKNKRWSVLANVQLRLKNQSNGKNRLFKFRYNFSELSEGYGLDRFITYKELSKSSNGFLLNNTIKIEAKIKITKSSKNKN